MAENRNILSVRDLSFSYEKKKILDGISFDVKEGDFISVLGPNGAGKSTLVNILSKVLKDFKGTVEVMGRDIRSMTARELARMAAVVPQSTDPGFDFTVQEMVMMGRHPYIPRFGSEAPKDMEIVRKVMEKTSITEFANRRFTHLSGGEKQRVIIAQALAQDSPILILDEATSHLDINFQIEFMNLFLKLNREEKKTVIGVFHNINLAIQNDSKVMMLKDGSIFAYGSVDRIINRKNLASVFHSDVFVGKNPVTGKIYVSPVSGPAYRTDGRKKVAKIHVIGGGGAASPLLALLHDNGYRVSCGVVNTFDSDLATSEMLDIPFVVEAPFSPVSPGSMKKNMEFIKASDIVILPEIEFGNGNMPNLAAAEEALSLKKKVLVIDNGNIGKRDHTGGKAQELYGRILKQGIVVHDAGQVLEKL